MEINKEQLASAAKKAAISQEQVNSLWQALLEEKLEQGTDISPFSKLLYYFGAMIVISAMTWLMGIGWELFGGGGIFIIAVAYALIFLILGKNLWYREGLKIPGGVLITLAVCMTPLAIYGLQNYLGWWPQEDEGKQHYRDFYHVIKSGWLLMEVGTIVAGVLALRFFPFPFITLPIFFAGWFLTMDIVPLLLGNESSYQQKEWLTLVLGALMMAVSYAIDRKTLRDFAFWGYLFGTLTFWGALMSLCWDKGEPVLLLCFAINILLMILSILLKRKILMIVGAIGAFIYLSHLAYEVFKDSLLFPFALSVMGLLIIYLGIWYQKNSAAIEAALLKSIPDNMKTLLPDAHED